MGDVVGDKKKGQTEIANDLATLLQQETTTALGYLPPQVGNMPSMPGISAGSQLVYGAMPPMNNAGLYKMANMPAEVQLEEEPMYVNAKQYHRILKRRAARAKWDAQIKASKAKKPYMHESRHRHAMRRPRGPGGRFLTAAEIAEMKKKEKEGGDKKSKASASASSSE